MGSCRPLSKMRRSECENTKFVSFRVSFLVIPDAERESSEVRKSCFVDTPSKRGKTVPPSREKGTKEKQAKTHKEGKRETALIGPGGRQPRAERGRGLCERSEFRSPRARRRRASEKARYRAAVLLGSFFSPKRRMNKNAPMETPSKRGMTSFRSANRRCRMGQSKSQKYLGSVSTDTPPRINGLMREALVYRISI